MCVMASAHGRFDRDDGFTLVEQLVAITLMFAVLLSLLGALGASASGVNAGRQKTIATSLGKGVIEQWQGSSHDGDSFEANIGMNLGEAGLAADARLTTAGGVRFLEGNPLAGSPTPTFPAHHWTTVQGSTTFTIDTYVTVSGTAGDDSRNVVVFVGWNGSGGQQQSLRFATVLYPLDYASFPAAEGSADTGGASVDVAGQVGLTGMINQALVVPPSARSTTTDATLRAARGTASGVRAAASVEGGLLPFLTCVILDLLTNDLVCAPTVSEAVGDNDAATAAGPHSIADANYVGLGLALTSGGVVVNLPLGRVTAKSTSEACAPVAAGCPFVADGGGDGHPWQQSTGESLSQANTVLLPAILGGGGSLWTIGSGWKSQTTIDHTTVAGGSATSTARLDATAVTVLPIWKNGLLGLPDLSFQGLATVSAFTATATASTGYSTAAPAISAPPVTVRLWDDAVGGYRTVSFTPGVSSPDSATATFGSLLDTIVATTTLETATGAAPVSTTVTTPLGTVRTRATADLPTVLRITSHVTVTNLTGSRTFQIVVDYGHVTARSTFAVQP
jgi:hypothetical protein